MTALFDDFERTDPSPAAAGEDSFSFLNRASTPFWVEVRRVLEDWFSRYPAQDAPALRQGFRSRLPGQHRAAWWELYLHELFVRLGYEVTIHPPLPDSKKTPDFKLRRAGEELYVEATVVFSGLGSAAPEPPPWLLDAVNQARNGDFFVRLVEISRCGSERLKDREIAQPLEQWLNGLDPDQVAAQTQAGADLPQLTIDRREWEVVFEAWPVSPGRRDSPNHRVLGAGPIQSGWANDIAQLKSKLKAKAGRYGQPQIPMVTAVLASSVTMKRLDVEQALFGREAIQVPMNDADEPLLVRQRNGFWFWGDGPQNQRVSAVLTAINLHPGNAVGVTPELWVNPWANHPLDQQWPFPQNTASDRGEIIHTAVDSDMSALFGLPADWPGGEPFPDEAS